MTWKQSNMSFHFIYQKNVRISVISNTISYAYKIRHYYNFVN